MNRKQALYLQDVVALVAGLILASMVFLTPVWAASSDTDPFSQRMLTFPGLAFGDPLSALGRNVQTGQLDDGVVAYVKTNENLSFGTFQANGIGYFFKDNRFYMVGVFVPVSSKAALIAALTKQYGEPVTTAIPVCGFPAGSYWFCKDRVVMVFPSSDADSLFWATISPDEMKNAVNDGLKFLDTTSGDLQLLDIKWEQKDGSRYIVGHVKNTGSSIYGFVNISVNIYDSDHNLIGNGLDGVYDLESGDIWKFRIAVDDDEAASIKVTKLEGELADEGKTTTTSSDGFTF